jgi:hypothetical protein
LEAKGKPTQHYVGASRSTPDVDKSRDECKAAIFQALYKWFRDTLFTHINRSFLALKNVVEKEAFQSHMRKVFKSAISGDRWEEDKWKFCFSKWMEEKLIDTLYNTVPILERYRKLQEELINQEQLAAFKNKINNFTIIMKN